ncbi:hypothetical protein [Desulforamulus putei]
MNNLVGDFFYSVNKDLINKNTRDTWHSHRKKTMETIFTASSKIANHTKNIVILGSGSCNDIELEDLVSHFSEIVLIDIDLESTKEAMKSLEISKQRAITLLNWDITGLHAKFIPKLIKLVTKIKDGNQIKKIIEFIQNQIDRLYLPPFPENLSQRGFDITVSPCISSQLFMPIFIEFILNPLQNKYVHTSPKKIEQLIMVANLLGRALANQHLLLLTKLTKPGGKIVFLSDSLEWGYNNGNKLPLTYIIKNPDELLDYKVINKIPEKYFIVGSTPNFYKDNLLSKIEAIQFWLWPFDYHRYYLVRGYIIGC